MSGEKNPRRGGMLMKDFDQATKDAESEYPSEEFLKRRV